MLYVSGGPHRSSGQLHGKCGSRTRGLYPSFVRMTIDFSTQKGVVKIDVISEGALGCFARGFLYRPAPAPAFRVFWEEYSVEPYVSRQDMDFIWRQIPAANRRLVRLRM